MALKKPGIGTGKKYPDDGAVFIRAAGESTRASRTSILAEARRDVSTVGTEGNPGVVIAVLRYRRGWTGVLPWWFRSTAPAAPQQIGAFR
jgi:hypothetical protein